MGLLGGGDDSSLASSSGWGVQPPPSSSDWGSSSANNNNNSSSGGGSTSLSGGNNNNNSAAGSGWASAGSCGSGAAVSAAMAINSTGSNQQTANGGLRGSQQQQQSSLNSNQANLLMSGNQSGDQQQQQSLLSSSPKPALSSSWAQAAGKGLVHATSANASGNASGPNASSTASAISSAGIITTNSHDTSNVGSGGGGLGLGAASSQQQQSSVASSCLSASSVATTANCSSGGLSMSGNVVSSTMAFGSGSGGSSSNGNGNSSSGPSAGGLNMLGGSSNVAGSSGNAMDAANAAANKRQMGGSSSTTTSGANINDLIGGLSDDFRETLFTEKWGSSVINQDSPWNLPSSSHASSSSPKVHQETSTWRCPVNSGTEIWESSIRQKKGSLGGPGGVGLLSSASVGMGVGGGPVQPWGQTPTTNIGGTWGEEEGIDTSNHWTGVPQSANSLNSVTSVGGGMAPTGGPSGLGGHSALGGHVNSSSINPNWSAGPSALSNGGPGSGISNPYSLLTPSGLGAGGLGGANNIGGGDGGGVGMNNWNGNDKSAYDSRKATNWGNFDQSDSVSESNWDKSGNDGGSFGTWNPPDNRKDGCWDKDSNDSFKGVDDGTAVWGNPGGRSGAGNSGQHGQLRQPQPPNWQKEQQQQQQQPKYGMPMPGVNKNGYSGNPGWNNGNNGGNKPLGQNMLTRTWTDASSGHRKSPSMWNDDSKSMNGSMTPNWSDGQIDTSSWGSSKPAKPLTREMILSSKQYRLLVDLGHKKDDAENALRNCGGRFEDALAHLETVKPIKSGFGVGGGIGNNPLMDFNKMTLSGAGGGNGGGNGRGHGGLAPMPPNVGGGASACPPASLHNLAQRIHLAVSTGFLNPAILNQPLSNQNLEILSELLNQIKNLKEVQGQMAQSGGSLKSSLEYRLREVRQNITQLQNQLRNDAGGKMTNNGIGKDYFEPNNDQGGHSMNKEVFQLSKGPVDNYGGGNGNAPGGHPGGGGGGLQGSRLFNWKHSKQQSAGEHGGPMGNDNFIRAPGGLPKANHSATNWSNFMDDNGGGGWPDKSGGDHMAGGGGLDCADYGGLGNFGAPMGAPDTFDSGYGKHSWKPAAKSALVDDDPRSPIAQKAMMGGDNSFSWNSGMGGGAASANAISKGSNSLLGGGGGGGGGGQGAGQMDSLNSPFGFSGNTWSYNSGPAPSSAAGNAAMGVNATPFNAADLNKNKNAMNNNSKPNNSHTWSNSGLNSGSDYSDSLWTSGGGGNNSGGNGGPAGGGAGAGKPRPPPGLSKSGSVTSGGNSIWSSGGSGSEYLRLRNLTPQIDGSTLKTLCCQHGPLNLFHLFLNHGAAIARYSNREQAIKAQSALNNCVLGNTTILADLPLESEVQQYLQLINGGGHSANPNGNGGQQSANSANGHNAHNSGGGGQQSHGGHHGGGGSGGGHHSGYGNPNTASWSNGTNASQSSAGGGAGHVQSNAAPSTAPIPLYSRTSSVGAVSAGPNSAPITVAHMSPFASGSAPVQVNQLPYNSGAPGLVSSVHSNYNSTLLSQAAGGVGVNSASQFSKMDNGLLSSWNTASSGSGGLWDSSALPGASGGLWSTGGYGAADRNTPIQNAFLPGDLLTGDNN